MSFWRPGGVLEQAVGSGKRIGVLIHVHSFLGWRPKPDSGVSVVLRPLSSPDFCPESAPARASCFGSFEAVHASKNRAQTTPYWFGPGPEHAPDDVEKIEYRWVRTIVDLYETKRVRENRLPASGARDRPSASIGSAQS